MEGRLDLLGELYSRGLAHLVEQILLATQDPLTVTACFQVCSLWTRWASLAIRQQYWRICIGGEVSHPAF